MAFPSIVGSPHPSERLNNNSNDVVGLPSAQAGELLIAVVGKDGSGSATWPSGWTELDGHAHSSFSATLAWKAATGSDPDPTVSWSHSERFVALVARIADWDGITPPEISLPATGASTDPNPPSLAPSWGAADTLWLALFASNSTSDGASAYPANYTHAQATHFGFSAASVGLAARQLNAESEDPGAFTAPSDDWVAWTVAIRPSSGGGPAPVSGSGGGVSSSATLSGIGGLAFRGTIFVTVPLASVSGDGQLGFTASGVLIAPPAATAGSGSVVTENTGIAGAGGLTAPLVEFGGSGLLRFSGSGSVAPAFVSAAASGALAFRGSGVLTAPAALFSASGSSGIAIEGTALVFDAAFGASVVFDVALHEAIVSDENRYRAIVSDEG